MKKYVQELVQVQDEDGIAVKWETVNSFSFADEAIQNFKALVAKHPKRVFYLKTDDTEMFYDFRIGTKYESETKRH